MSYSLHVMFKSNEAPWSSTYKPVAWMQPVDDAAAFEWARGMAKGLNEYTCTLMRDGKVIPIEEWQKPCEVVEPKDL